jgi:predicted N-formylglutamate amidohydrolase
MKWTAPFEIIAADGAGPLVIVCDHASNAVPLELGDLGVSAADMQRHIAYDIGAAAIARHLSKHFDAPAVLSGTSRLVIDSNRKLYDPTLIPDVSDGTPIPGNLGLTSEQRERRIIDYFTSYHDACRRVIGSKLARGSRPLFVSVHSMTDRMNGKYRPWEISFSSNANRRATDPALAALRKHQSLVVGDNQPYDMDPDQDYGTPEHALLRGLDYLQVEFRQDLVATEEGQHRFATIFADAVTAAVAACACR